ncbi:MAG: lysoplasmalogenase [Hyphomicrobiales bacterium]|nr:lysoplasmalogenase [Hyphomicrobiales bacterium]
MENITSVSLAIALLIAIVYGLFWLSQATSWTRTVFKTLPVALLTLTAWIGGQPMLLIAALGLSAVGDAFLSTKGEKSFLAGLGAFLTAHLAYIALFLLKPASNSISSGTYYAVWTLTCLLIVLALISLWRHLARMKIPVLIYTLIIGAMNITAWTTGQNSLLLVGVGFFLFSDLLLAHRIFVWQEGKIKRMASFAVWYSYFAAQLIILHSFF